MSEVVSVDVNLDGAPDLLAALGGSGPVGILLGDGNGLFTVMPPYSPGTGTFALAAGDLDEDGLPDLVVTSTATDTAYIALGDGAGGFSLAASVAFGGDPVDVVLHDLDLDGHLDLVAALAQAASVGVALGDGSGNFVAHAFVATGGDEPVQLGIGELTGDGVPDLVVGYQSDATVDVFEGDGAGGFQSIVSLTTALQCLAVHVVDMDADGFEDVVFAADNSSLPVGIFSGAGDGTFGPVQVVPSALRPEDLVVGDVDADGDLDLVATYEIAEVGAIVFTQGGDGAFSVAQELPDNYVGDKPRSVVLVDVNRDGRLDIVVGEDDDGEIGVLLNAAQPLYLMPEEYELAPLGDSVCVEDIDGDMQADVVLLAQDSSSFASRVFVYSGLGNGSLDVPIEYPLESSGGIAADLEIADVTGDGLVDLCTVDVNSDHIVYLPGIGGVGFGPEVRVPAGIDPVELRLGDMNGDEVFDAVIVHDTDELSVQIGDGAGGFGVRSVTALDEEAGRPVLGDVDGDGKLDVLVPHGGSTDAIWLLLGDGAGAFEVPAVWPVGDQPRELVLADFDGDDTLDVAISHNSVDSLWVELGVGDGSFAPGTTFALNKLDWLRTADVDRDGHLDLVARRDLGGTQLIVLLGRGDGTFQEPGWYAGVFGNGTLGDLDGDGRPELVSAQSGLHVALNRSDAWAHLGAGLHGSDGVPSLVGEGELEPGTTVTITLVDAATLAPVTLFVGFSVLDAPFKGGTLFPQPDVILSGLSTDADGALSMAATWPAGLPGGFELFLQAWIVDAAGPQGLAASLALSGTAP